VKVHYANDTQFHAGSVAVSVAITNRLREQGHKIVGITRRPQAPDTEALEACDALVVNGEGTFRDEHRQWEPGRIAGLMYAMEEAKALGKRVHLVNATWFNMLPHWGRILSTLDEVAVREPLSAREMAETTGVHPAIYLDASYYAPVDYATWAFAVPQLRGKIVMGHLYPHNFPDLLTEDHPAFAEYRANYLPMIPFDAASQPEPLRVWPEFVVGLEGAALYITGQHHGVYAACKARTPFVACKCNTWKVEGLFEWADVDIPIVRNADDVPYCIEWALSKPPEFEKLWRFMETCPQWPGVVE